MAKNKNQRSTGRSQNDSSMNEDMDSEDQGQQQSRPQRSQGGQQGQSRQASSQGGQQGGQQEQQGQPADILQAITPAFQEARRYVEGSPVRAAAIGAIAGGLLMTLFSTEKGRGFVKLAYGYANPMVSKYAREYISQAAGNAAEQALGGGQH